MERYLDYTDFDKALEEMEKGDSSFVEKVFNSGSLRNIGSNIVIGYLLKCIEELSESSGVDKEDILEILFGNNDRADFESVYRICNSMGCFKSMKNFKFSKIGMESVKDKCSLNKLLDQCDQKAKESEDMAKWDNVS